MKVFISSVISGYEEFREAVDDAIHTLGHEVIRAEDFPAADSSSRVACLSGVREADLVILLLGVRYGARLAPRNIAPTHEEFLEAKNQKPILVFKQAGIELERDQQEFVELVEDWDDGRHRTTFSTAEDLKRGVLRALHQFELNIASAPVNVNSLKEEAMSSLGQGRSNAFQSTSGSLHLAIAGGPSSQILRPRELEAKELESEIAKDLIFGANQLFDRSLGTQATRSSGVLTISQSDGRSFALSERGSIRISAPIVEIQSGIPCVIIEDVEELIESFLMVCADVLDKVDSGNKISRVVFAAQALGTEYTAWRTRAEHAASPNSITHGFAAKASKEPVFLTPPDRARASLRYDKQVIAEDLATLLRREASSEERGY